MAQTGFTPILIYASGTTGNTPSAGNLTSSANGAELAINYFDGKLFYKDASGNVQVLASKAGNINVSSISFGTTGLTPNTATTGAITVTGTLITSNGGTGLASYTAGDLPYYASGTALSKLGIGTSGQILTSSGTAPQWSTLSGVAVTTFQTSLSGLTPSTATSGAITLAGTLGVASGGTGLNSLSSGYIPYGNGTSAFSSNANFLFDGTNLNLKSSGNLNFVYGSSSQGINFQNGVGTTIQQIKYLDSNGSLTIGGASGTSVPIIFNTSSSTEAMRLNTSGYLGIGTSSPSTLLQINASGASPAWLYSTNATSGSYFGTSGTGETIVYQTGAYPIQFYTNSLERMRLDSSGNLGLGVTPSAWTSAFKVVEIGSKGGALAGASGEVDLFNNAYNNGSNYIYGISSYATQFQMNNLGQFRWYTAPSGTAGTTATFTQAMTLTNAGGLSVGTTSDAGAGNIRASGVFYAGDGSTSNNAFARAGGSGTGIYFPAANTIGFSTSASEVARIDSSGNLGLGVIPSAWGSSRKAIQAGVGASLQGSTGTYGFAEFGANFYYNGTSDIYLASDYASKYRQISGQHQFYVAPSSTGTISFTQAMTLDNSGNLGIGTTSPAAALEISRTSANPTFNLTAVSNGSPVINMTPAGSGIGAIQVVGAFPLTFYTNSSERARIDSSGNLLVGTTATNVTSGGFNLLFNSGSSYETIGHATGSASGGAYLAFRYNNGDIGTITQNGTTGVLYNLTSDYRLKNNPTALTGASEFIMALQPKTWDWHDGSGKGVGFIAHEFMEVAKYSGNGTKDAVDAEGNPIYQSIQPSSSEVMANLVALVQEQQAIIEQLKAKVGI